MENDLLIVAHFTNDFGSKGNTRFNYLANLLAVNHFNVELVTSDFSHGRKKKRGAIAEKYNYKITPITEPVYRKNISIKRFYSHYMMSQNLKKYLNNRKIPDLIYCAVPSLDVAKVAIQYAKSHRIPVLIDVQDLWPQAFKMVFNIPVISELAFYPMQKKANYIYSNADEIIAVSETYAKEVLQVNNVQKKAHSIYIGTDLDKFDEIDKFSGKKSDEIWLVYIGTLGHSYDLPSVIDALEIIEKVGITNIKFIVMGDGPLRTKFESYAKRKNVNADFTGTLDYKKMVGILKVSDIAINPISKGAAGSIINKHADYAAAGLPVINTQENIEYRGLVEDYQMGLNCENNNPVDLSEKLMILYEDKSLRNKMALNSRRLAKEKFDRGKSYEEIVGIISELLESKKGSTKFL